MMKIIGLLICGCFSMFCRYQCYNLDHFYVCNIVMDFILPYPFFFFGLYIEVKAVVAFLYCIHFVLFIINFSRK